MAEDGAQTNTKDLTVAICTDNREKRLPHVFKPLRSQVNTEQIIGESITVDNQSKDGTAHTVKA